MADDDGFDLVEGCIGFVWNCVQFWTTLSAATILICIIYRPQHFHPHVDSAVLSALNLTAATANATDHRSLRYDLAANISLRNWHRRLNLRYQDVAASAFYSSTRLGPANDALPAPFTQGPKNTTVLHPVFEGTATVDSSIAAELESELAAGTVHVRVTLSLTLRYKIGFSQDIAFHQYDCWLWFPPPLDGAPAIFDSGTRCWEAK
ncbi:hypothetical protein ACP70R_007980 [Stipagrostis hirtigluma subsp. patula]